MGMLAFSCTSAFSVGRSRSSLGTDVTFIFTSDVHACMMHGGLAPNCQLEGKTDENLRRHIHAINGISDYTWPSVINGKPTGLVSAREPIHQPAGMVVGGDMTDDGGGQTRVPGEGTQLLQFSQRYKQGTAPDQIHFPVYVGLGNHDLDQDGPRINPDWYRQEMRDYVEFNHHPSAIYKPPLPATNYDVYSDDYSWDWGSLHLVQAHRFAGDTRKGATDSLPWLRQDLSTYAADGRPVIVFQHYGWDSFSTGQWDSRRQLYDSVGTGPSRWWSKADRDAMLSVLVGYNIIGIFHGHQHETPMIYRKVDFDVVKPKAAFLGGFAVVRVADTFMDIVLAETSNPGGGPSGGVVFTDAYSKSLRRG